MNSRRQKGATFVSWMIGAGIFIFLAITGIKLAPVYLQYNSVRGLVNDLAVNPATQNMNKRMLKSTLDKHLDISMLDKDISSDNFEIRNIKGKKNARELAVKYEVRKPWFANLDFIANFDYSKEIGVE